ncbi:MAG: ABC transporter permease, partial [Betaproteobacteria bacterium]|nr:ABC transporter permease [Betaproteobacteria bacterium]
MAERPAVTARPEFVREAVREHDIGVVLKPLTAWERIWGNGWLRKGLILTA